MASLKDMLEPGETVLHEASSLKNFARLPVGTAGFMVAITALLVIDFNEHTLFQMLEILGLVMLGAVLLLGVVSIPMTLMLAPFEACIVTDRRILFRPSLRRPEISEITLSEIEDVGFRGNELRIAAPGQVVTLQPDRLGIGAVLLTRILPKWFPEGGKPVDRPGRLLNPGERIVFHFPPRYLGWVGKISAICFAGLFLSIGYSDFVERDWAGILSTIVLAAMILWHWYPARDDRHGWYSLVTNRRLLQHFDWDHSRYEEIPLAEIEAEWRSQFAEKLAARHNGRDLDIPAKGKDAERVLAAIEAAKEATP